MILQAIDWAAQPLTGRAIPDVDPAHPPQTPLPASPAPAPPAIGW